MVERAASRRLVPVCCLAQSDLRRRIAVSVPSTSAAEHPCARALCSIWLENGIDLVAAGATMANLDPRLVIVLSSTFVLDSLTR